MTIEARIIAPVQGEGPGTLLERTHDHLLGDLDQRSVALEGTSGRFEHAGGARIVAPHAPLFEHPDGGGMDPRTFFLGNGIDGTDQFPGEALHVRLSLAPSPPTTLWLSILAAPGAAGRVGRRHAVGPFAGPFSVEN
jgi:hypothetical protein